MVRFKDGTSAADIQSAITAQSMIVVRAWKPKNYYVLQTPNGADERPILQYFNDLGTVQYVRPNMYVGVSSFTFDPFFAEQSQWPQVGLVEDDNPPCDPNDPTRCMGSPNPTSGWVVTTGSFRRLVAVIDDGFDLTNPDIAQNLFINPGEVPQQILNGVGNINGDTQLDWRDLDFDHDGVLTFGDLDLVNAFCAGTHWDGKNFVGNCAVINFRVCSTTPCVPTALVSGSGKHDEKACGATPKPLNGTWEDGVDGDCNGFVDDLVGWNFNCGPDLPDGEIPGCNLPKANPTPAKGGGAIFKTHGTTVASIIGAAGANGHDTAGIAWQVRLLPIQARLRPVSTTVELEAFSDTVFMGAQYAAQFKPDVANISLGDLAVLENEFINGNVSGPAPPGCAPVLVVPKNKPATFDALRDKLNAEISELQTTFSISNTLVVIAGGNCQVDLDQTDFVIEYPGSMRGSNVLVVGSVGASGHGNVDQQSSFSNFGSGHIDLAAPGEFFVESLVTGISQGSVYAGSGTGFPACEPLSAPPPGDVGCAGTSFAAPMVAGAAALMITADGTLEHKPCEVAQRILHSAKAITDLSNLGGRRLDVKAALHDTFTSQSCQ